MDRRLSKARVGRRGEPSPSAESGLKNEDTALDVVLEIEVVDIIEPEEVGRETADISELWRESNGGRQTCTSECSRGCSASVSGSLRTIQVAFVPAGFH